MKTKLIAMFMIIGLYACKKGDTADPIDCTGSTPVYTTNVKPILDARCATSGCHDAGSKAKGIDLSSYATAKAAAGNNSFIGSVRHLSGYDAMPQGGSKLSDADIKTLYCWVQNGMPQ